MHPNATFRPALRRRRWTVVVVAGLIGLVVVLLVWEREPVVNGRTVTEWANIKLDSKPGPTGAQLRRDADVALQKAGMAGLPVLVRLMKVRDSGWYDNFALWSRRRSWFPGHLTTAYEKRAAGAFALTAFGTNAATVLPEIATYGQKDDVNTGGMVAYYAYPLAESESIDPLGLPEYLPISGWIYPSSSKSRSTFVCAACVLNTLPLREKIMKIGLRHRDGRLLDWVEIRSGSAQWDWLSFGKVGQADGEGFKVTTGGRNPWPRKVAVSSSATNFNTILHTYASEFRIRVVNDHFVFPPADGK